MVHRIIPAHHPKVIEFLKNVAAAREKIHEGQLSSRPLSEDYELIGLLGEWQFSQEFGLPIDLTLKPKGDNRVDFRLEHGWTIDVKTARKPYNLLRERNVAHADILVLAGYNEDTNAVTLIGWEFDVDMVRCPYKDFGYGIENHFKPDIDLRPIRVLWQLIARKSGE